MTEANLIAHAMTGALRQLLSALVAHHATVVGLKEQTLADAKRAMDAEIERMGMEAVGNNGEKIDLSDALQASIRIVVDAALVDARKRIGLSGAQRLN